MVSFRHSPWIFLLFLAVLSHSNLSHARTLQYNANHEQTGNVMKPDEDISIRMKSCLRSGKRCGGSKGKKAPCCPGYECLPTAENILRCVPQPKKEPKKKPHPRPPKKDPKPHPRPSKKEPKPHPPPPHKEPKPHPPLPHKEPKPHPPPPHREPKPHPPPPHKEPEPHPHPPHTDVPHEEPCTPVGKLCGHREGKTSHCCHGTECLPTVGHVLRCVPPPPVKKPEPHPHPPKEEPEHCIRIGQRCFRRKFGKPQCCPGTKCVVDHGRVPRCLVHRPEEEDKACGVYGDRCSKSEYGESSCCPGMKCEVSFNGYPECVPHIPEDEPKPPEQCLLLGEECYRYRTGAQQCCLGTNCVATHGGIFRCIDKIPSESPSPSSSMSASPSSTATASVTPSISSTATASVTPTSSMTATPSMTATASVTPTPSPTASTTATATPSNSVSPTPTPSPCPAIPTEPTGARVCREFWQGPTDAVNSLTTFESLTDTCSPEGSADIPGEMILSGAPYCQVTCDPLAPTCPSFTRTVEATFKVTLVFAPPATFNAAARNCLATVMLQAYSVARGPDLPDCAVTPFEGGAMTDPMNLDPAVQAALTACGGGTLSIVEFQRPGDFPARVDAACS